MTYDPEALGPERLAEILQEMLQERREHRRELNRVYYARERAKRFSHPIWNEENRRAVRFLVHRELHPGLLEKVISVEQLKRELRLERNWYHQYQIDRKTQNMLWRLSR